MKTRGPKAKCPLAVSCRTALWAVIMANLVIMAGAADVARAKAPLMPAKSPSFNSVAADQRLERSVRRVLQDDPVTRPFAKQATVRGGTVTLAGQTYHAKAKDAAESAVKRLSGVRSVRNQIVVEPNRDLEIAQELHAAFSEDPSIHDGAIGVTVIKGQVYLSGTAESADEVARANQIALSTPGVVRVSNGLEVTATPAVRVPGRSRALSGFQPWSSYKRR